MSSPENMPKASFKGFEFPIVKHDRKGGPKGVHHVYAARDNGDVEHLGIGDDDISIDTALFGDDCFEQREALIKLLLEPGPGELVHPWYGRLWVSVKTGGNGFSISGPGNETGIVRITMNFIRHGKSVGLTVQSNTKADLKSASSEARTIAKETFVSGIKLQGVPGFVRQELRLDVQKLQEIATGLSFSGDVITKVSEGLGSVSEIAAAIENATSFTGNALSVLNVAAKLPEKFIAALEDIPNSTGELATAARQIQAFNRGLMTGFITASSAVTYAETAISAEFETYDDAVSALRSGQSLMALAIEQNDDAQTIESIKKVKTAFSKHIQSTSGDLSRIVTVSHAFTQPAVLRAYDIYEDLDREAEILRRNRISNPNKLLPTEPLEVLSV